MCVDRNLLMHRLGCVCVLSWLHRELPLCCVYVCAAGITDPALASLVYICNSSITTYDVTAGRAEPSSHSLPDSKLPQVRKELLWFNSSCA
jgi:hypothetical protein